MSDDARTEGARRGASAEALDVLTAGVAAAAAYGRPDFEERLTATRRRLAEPAVQVVVIGEFKQGKSSLINALLNAPICPVDDDIATAVPTAVRYGKQRQAWAILSPDADSDAEPERQSIEYKDIADYATERRDDAADDVKGVDVELPRKLLQNGLVLIDTPGVGGLGSAHATASLGALSVADAAVFVSDASQEYTQTEMNFLEQALEMCPKVICVMTKTDFYPAWRTVLSLNEGHLRRAGHDLAITPVSSALRIEAIRREDQDLNRESGILDLLSIINDDVMALAAERGRMVARRDLLAVTGQLIGQFEAELAVLNDPAARAELMTRLQEATAKSDRLRGQASKWSTTLNDGIGDLTSNVDFDFRQRMRIAAAEADAAIDETDPIDTWDEFEPWLISRVSFEVIGNYRLLTESATELSRTVAEHFELDGGQVLDQLEIENPAHILSNINANTSLNATISSKKDQGLSALRGTQSGVMMLGMVGSWTMVAVNPIALGVVGLAVLGRKALKDDKQRAVTQRRAQAKVVVRKYNDEVTFQVNKDSRDTLRRTQRQLRDYYSARAEELHRSTSETLAAATTAAQTGDAQRNARVRSVEAELKRLRALDQRATALADVPAGALR